MKVFYASLAQCGKNRYEVDYSQQISWFFLFCFFDYTPAIDGILEIRLALNVSSIENIKFGKLKIDKTVPDSSEYWTIEYGSMKAILMKPNGTKY